MASDFDPYHRWLSIPPSEQPPNHYRLLGLQPFELSVDVIRSAAERQMAHVKLFLDSPLRAYAVNLVRELDVARKCLLDAEAKAAYDAWLGQRVKYPRRNAPSPVKHRDGEGAEPTTVEPISTATVTRPVRPSRAVESHQSDAHTTYLREGALAVHPGSAPFPSVAATPIRRRRKRSNSPLTFIVFWLLGGAIGLLAGYAVLCMIDPKYDFLNLMFKETPNVEASETPSVAAKAEKRTVEETDKAPTKSRSVERRSNNLREGPTSSFGQPQGMRPSPHDLDLRITPSRQPIRPPRTKVRIEVPSVLPLPSSELRSTPQLFASLPPGIDFDSDQYELRLSLMQGANHSDGRLNLKSGDKIGGTERAWLVEWTPTVADLAEIEKIVRSDVATFSAIDNEIRFTWAADVELSAVSAMRNSMLKLQIGQSQHDVALRAAEDLPPLTIDLRRPKSTLIRNLDDPPEIEKLRFDVTDPAVFPLYRTEGAGLRGLRLDDVTTLWYREATGLATRLSVIKRGRRLAVQIETTYRLPSGYEGVLTITRAKNKMEELQEKLAAANAFKARASAGQQLEVNKVITETQSNIDALERIGKLAEKLHEVRVPIRVYLEVAGHRVELASTD